MENGLRVVPGPDWLWGDQDGGEGNVGTVVHLGGNINGCPTKFWFTGILESRRIIGQDMLESVIFESLTPLKQASKLLTYVCGEELSVFVISVLV